MTRNQLKILIKECLAEILVEGLGEGSLVERASTKSANTQQTRFSAVLDEASKRKKVFASSRSNKNSQDTLSPSLKNAIITESGGDSVLMDILTDTAKTTLPQVINAERRGAVQGVPALETFVAENEPEVIFGQENVNKWAELAFMDSNSKLSKG